MFVLVNCRPTPWRLHNGLSVYCFSYPGFCMRHGAAQVRSLRILQVHPYRRMRLLHSRLPEFSLHTRDRPRLYRPALTLATTAVQRRPTNMWKRSSPSSRDELSNMSSCFRSRTGLNDFDGPTGGNPGPVVSQLSKANAAHTASFGRVFPCRLRRSQRNMHDVEAATG